MWVRFVDFDANNLMEWTFGGTGDDTAYGLDVTADGAVAILERQQLIGHCGKLCRLTAVFVRDCERAHMFDGTLPKSGR